MAACYVQGLPTCHAYHDQHQLEHRRALALLLRPVKLSYFRQLSADDDDHELGAAKVMGYVPETCLMGGRLVWMLIRSGDPCSNCLGPREKCGGRPSQDSDTSSEMEKAFSDFRDVLNDRGERE